MLHSTTNARSHLPSALAEITPPELGDKLLRWLDDNLFHGKAIIGLLDSVTRFAGIFLDITSSYTHSRASFSPYKFGDAGEIISANGIKFESKRLDRLGSIEPQKTRAPLQKFLCALQLAKQA